ncbi:hypothetical protein LguiA_019892 [Lonicera macranthoides]
MTIDDDNSVYVGGIPYDTTEETVRNAFDLYGHVVAVKINKDHGTGGKCYGFVTFTNPRSAVDAINDMNGRTIDGQVVKVNEVRTRGMRSNFGGDNFRRNSDRGRDRDKRDFDRDRGRDQNRDRHRERSRDHHDHQNRERGFARARGDHDQTRARFVGRDRVRDHDRAMEDIEQESERNLGHERERDRISDWEQDKEMEITKNNHRRGIKDRDQAPKLLTGSKFSDWPSREVPSASSDDDHEEVDKRLDISKQKLGELQREVSHMEELVEEKGQVASSLKEKSQILEDALKAAKKLNSHRQMQLAKSMVDSTMVEIEYGDDVGIVPPVLANGDA